jgi:hypothetical protein
MTLGQLSDMLEKLERKKLYVSELQTFDDGSASDRLKIEALNQALQTMRDTELPLLEKL